MWFVKNFSQVTQKNCSDEETESKPAANGEAKKEETPAAEPTTTEVTTTDGEATTEVKQKKEWIVNLWLKRQVAGKLPKIKPIPGFCKLFFKYISS